MYVVTYCLLQSEPAPARRASEPFCLTNTGGFVLALPARLAPFAFRCVYIDSSAVPGYSGAQEENSKVACALFGEGEEREEWG